MHIPPGRDGYTGANSLGTGGKLLWDSTLLYRGMKAQFFFVSLIATYKNDIIGLIGGHTHSGWHSDGTRLH